MCVTREKYVYRVFHCFLGAKNVHEKKHAVTNIPLRNVHMTLILCISNMTQMCITIMQQKNQNITCAKACASTTQNNMK
jgi:hypothetical protein